MQPQDHYEWAQATLVNAKKIQPDVLTKSGIMVGLGEEWDEILAVMQDLVDWGVDILTIGQCLQPSAAHSAIDRFYTPAGFAELERIGLELGLPESLIWRQPFPGPGLAIRVIGEVTRQRLEILRRVDAVLLEEIRNNNYYKKLWQSFAVLLPIKSVGVMGDKRTYENIIAIRAVARKLARATWMILKHQTPYEAQRMFSG